MRPQSVPFSLSISLSPTLFRSLLPLSSVSPCQPPTKPVWSQQTGRSQCCNLKFEENETSFGLNSLCKRTDACTNSFQSKLFCRVQTEVSWTRVDMMDEDLGTWHNPLWPFKRQTLLRAVLAENRCQSCDCRNDRFISVIVNNSSLWRHDLQWITWKSCVSTEKWKRLDTSISWRFCLQDVNTTRKIPRNRDHDANKSPVTNSQQYTRGAVLKGLMRQEKWTRAG